MATLAGLVAAAYAMLFAAALLGKLDSWRLWSEAVAVFIPRRTWVTAGVRFGVPIVEGALAALTLSYPSIGLLVCGALLAVFAVVVALLQRHHDGTECNCFGSVASSQINLSLAARDAVLAGAAIAVAVAVWNLNVSRLSPSEILILLALGSLLLVSTEFRKFSQIEERRSGV